MAVIKFKNSSSFKLATFFTLLLALSVGIVIYLIVIANNQDLTRQVESEINADIQIFNELEMLDANSTIEKIVSERIRKKDGRYFYNFENTSQKNVVWPDKVETLKEGLIKFSYNDFEILAKIQTFRNGQKILIGRNIAGIDNTQTAINGLGAGIIFAMIVVVLVGYLVGNYVVNLINTISDTADDIMKSGDLSRRIPVTHQRDDLSKLAYVLNSMFDRIEELVAGVRQVSDNIAHDLRTPLARLRNKLEGFQGTDEEKQKLIAEADNLISIFNALLRIARIEQSKDMARFNQIDMQQLLGDVIELYEPLAESKKQKLEIKLAKAKIIGDKDLLFQMFANVLDNAIKFTPKKGVIKISAKINESSLKVSISDSGKGIAEQDKDKIFTRFYRAESSRSTAGHGLGLSLVSAIAELHSAKITIADNKPGLIFTINFAKV